MPAMRPLNSISMTAETPISAPPIVEASGVNSVTVIQTPRPRQRSRRSWGPPRLPVFVGYLPLRGQLRILMQRWGPSA